MLIKSQIVRKKSNATEKAKTDFEDALRELNYKKQRNILQMAHTPIGGLVMSGDPDDLLDLLYYNILEDQSVDEDTQLTFLFDAASSIYDEFWVALAKWLHFNIATGIITDKEKKDILTFLIRDKFCAGIGMAHQDIIFKIVCSNKDLTKLESTLDDFWYWWNVCIDELKYVEKMPDWQYKVLFILIDEMETVSEERVKSFENAIDKLKETGKFHRCLEVLLPVTQMTAPELYQWLEDRPKLNKIGLKPAMADDIIRESKGKIKGIIRIFREKTQLDVPLIRHLKIN